MPFLAYSQSHSIQCCHDPGLMWSCVLTLTDRSWWDQMGQGSMGNFHIRHYGHKAQPFATSRTLMKVMYIIYKLSNQTCTVFGISAVMSGYITVGCNRRWEKFPKEKVPLIRQVDMPTCAQDPIDYDWNLQNQNAIDNLCNIFSKLEIITSTSSWILAASRVMVVLRQTMNIICSTCNKTRSTTPPLL